MIQSFQAGLPAGASLTFMDVNQLFTTIYNRVSSKKNWTVDVPCLTSVPLHQTAYGLANHSVVTTVCPKNGCDYFFFDDVSFFSSHDAWPDLWVEYARE